jgi:hypothetical protein
MRKNSLEIFKSLFRDILSRGELLHQRGMTYPIRFTFYCTFVTNREDA